MAAFSPNLEERWHLEELRARVAKREAQWLRARGWTQTSSTPCHYWLWQHEWEGKTLLVEQRHAVLIQAAWDGREDYRLHPEKYED